MTRAAILFALILAGCGQTEPPQVIAPAPKRNEKIPVEVSYPIIKEWDDQTRRGVDVRLNMKVTAEVLREIALEIKGQETRQYSRTLISYRLPQYDSAARDDIWARTDFDPTLTVRLLGSDLATETATRNMQIDKTGLLFGPWFKEGEFCSIDFIYRDAGGVKIAECYQQGKRANLELVEVDSTVGRRFKLKNGNDQFELGPSGELRIYGTDNRLLRAMPPIEPPKIR